MDERFPYPPIAHVFFRFDQPDETAWDALRALAATWNATHHNRFVAEGDELSVTLARGILDPERELLERALEQLRQTHGCAGLEGVESRYTGPADYVTADYVRIAGGHAPAGFVANEIEAVGRPRACEACGREGRDEDRPLLAPLRVDEDLLARSLEARHQPPPDLVNLSNGALLISKRCSDRLRSCGATGLSLHEILRGDTHLPSEHYFLLAATTAIVCPCPTHTPTRGEPCSVCGAGTGTLLGDLHVEDALVAGLDLVSRHRFGLARLHLSRRLYEHLSSTNPVDLVATWGVDRCRHRLAPERTAAAMPVAMPRASRASRPECSVEAFMELVRRPNPTVECIQRGHDGHHRTFALETMLEPGGRPRRARRAGAALPRCRPPASSGDAGEWHAPVFPSRTPPADLSDPRGHSSHPGSGRRSRRPPAGEGRGLAGPA